MKFLIDRFSLFTARELARAAGKIISMYPVVGNVASLMTNQIYFAIENLFQKRLKRICYFDKKIYENLTLKRMGQDYFSHVLVYSDASNVAAAAYSIE